MTIQSKVSKTLTNEPTLTLKEMLKLYPNKAVGTITSSYYRSKKLASNNAKLASDVDDSRITMDLVENLIIRGKTPIPLLRVMTDFLKVKSQDHSELEEIDLSIFYKKAMEE